MSLAVTMVGVAFVLLVVVPKVKMLQVRTVLSKGVTKALQGHYHILADCDTIEVAHPLIESACLPTFAPDCITLEGCYVASSALLCTCKSLGTRLNLKVAAYWVGPCIDRKVVPA